MADFPTSDGMGTTASPSEQAAALTGIEAELSRMPTHARCLLRVRVPLSVTLASQRKSVQEIVELGPGSILKFDKTCDQPLELFLGNRPLARGEVVKVGDKFGLRISGLVGKVAVTGHPAQG
jgi:flagellar motor switch protein FliN/FliY